MLEPPDPSGEMPRDWQPIRWRAYQELSAGASYAAAGATVGRSKGTISKWIGYWRAVYGPDLLARDGRSKPNSGRELGAMNGGVSTALRWVDLRNAAALECGVTAGTARELALEVLNSHLGDSAEAVSRRAKLTASDILDLARAADILAKRADILADVVDPTRAMVVQQNNVVTAVGDDAGTGLLAKLEAAARGEGQRAVLDSVDVLLEEYYALVDPADVIDIDEAS